MRWILATLTALTCVLMFQNCGGSFRSQEESLASTLPGPDTVPLSPPDVGNGPLEDGSALPQVGSLIWESDFTGFSEINEDFNVYAGTETYRETIGATRDLFYEEGYLSRPNATLVMGPSQNTNGVLRIASQPLIAVDSGLSPADCNDLILNTRRWGPDGTTLAENPDGFKLQVHDALQARDGDTRFWDALNDCRLYTGRISSKRRFGPGTRIQARINMSEVNRTGYIYMFRLTSAGAYDNNPQTGVDMSIAEFGWGKFGDPSRATSRSVLNTAVRYNYTVAPFDGYLSFLTDTSVVDQVAYRASQTWNTNLITDRFATSMVETLPEPMDLMEGWYVFTLDWRADRLDFYFQKQDENSPPVRYLSVTEPSMISQSCDQEIYLGNNVSQTFAETKTGTLWGYVQDSEMAPNTATIASGRYPVGRSYRVYESDSMQVDWVRAYEIPGGSGGLVCPEQ